MKEFWIERSSRERMLLMGLSALITITVVYYLVFSPITNWRQQAARSVVAAQTEYDFVLEAAKQSSVTLGTTKATPSSELRTVLISTARDSGIILNYVNARSEEEIEANVEDVSSSALFIWLQELEQDHGVAVSAIDIARDNASDGALRVQIVFRTDAS